jgi:dihydrofolate synthase/folylpolyglutamate synthase
MTFTDSVRFLYSIGNEAKTLSLGLERMEQTVRALGHPERGLRFIHVAGTNGKGSVCAMVESGLRQAGFRTGLYTSPHLVSPTERIRLQGRPVTEDEFASAFDQVHEAVADLSQHPTYFETVTAMAFLLFAKAQVDFVVLEVGLGGRLDATNVVTPELCVITPVSLDHQKYLGDTVAQISGEKAGILKRGVPAVISAQHPEALEVIRSRALQLDVPLIETHTHEPLPYAPPLAGRHQVENCLTAVMALESLGLDGECIRQGIGRTQWPGRLELVRRRPDVYLDGAHNLAGIEALADFIQDVRSNLPASGRVWLIFAAMADKPVAQMGERLFPLADEIVLTAPAFERALDPRRIPAPEGARVAPTVREALAMIGKAAPEDTVFITGSLFLVGEARPMLLKKDGHSG